MHFVVPTYLRFKSKFCRIIEKKKEMKKQQRGKEKRNTVTKYR